MKKQINKQTMYEILEYKVHIKQILIDPMLIMQDEEEELKPVEVGGISGGSKKGSAPPENAWQRIQAEIDRRNSSRRIISRAVTSVEEAI